MAKAFSEPTSWQRIREVDAKARSTAAKFTWSPVLSSEGWGSVTRSDIGHTQPLRKQRQ